MPRLPDRVGPVAVAILLAVGAGAPEAHAADGPAASAALQCEHVPAPGRVKCSVELTAPAGRSIAWADVVIVELPELAAALKGRIGPADATLREATGQRWAFGLVARKAGQGELRARVRAVLCEGPVPEDGARCAPAVLEVKATVQVG